MCSNTEKINTYKMYVNDCKVIANALVTRVSHVDQNQWEMYKV